MVNQSKTIAFDDDRATMAQFPPNEPANVAPITTASGDKDHNAQLVMGEVVRQRAYQKWENAGKPDGDGTPFWLEAEKEMGRENRQ